MWIIVLVMGEIAKLIMLKKQKYFTPVRMIGILSIFLGMAFQQSSNNQTQAYIVGGLLIFGFLLYVIGWNRKREVDVMKTPHM